MNFSNSTALDSQLLLDLFERWSAPFDHKGLTVRVAYTRSAPFSGMCRYRDARIHINLGRSLAYPYPLLTHVARARSAGRRWWREAYVLPIESPVQLALFIYLHELYHHLVYSAGRCPRRKEAMCDRFAARVLCDAFGLVVRDAAGETVPRSAWDFQDLEGFVRPLSQRSRIQPA